MGAVEGNFALLLLLATLVTGIYWVAEKLVFLPQRRRAAQQAAGRAARRSGGRTARPGHQPGRGRCRAGAPESS
jgi:signal peptidase I